MTLSSSGYTPGSVMSSEAPVSSARNAMLSVNWRRWPGLSRSATSSNGPATS
nr:hypothetical protein [Nocardia cyriacigeorgica]